MDKKFNKKIFAQAATELAIFGAILLFLIGGLVRVGFQQTMGMNEQLRVMRMALAESWRTAQGMYTKGSSGISRNSANILILEDRISPDAGQKFGGRDRTPYMASSSGSFSQNFMYSLDEWQNKDLPLYDIIVNGQRFPLTTAAFKTYSYPTTLPGIIAAGYKPCDGPHPDDTRCYHDGHLIFYRHVHNYNGSLYAPNALERYKLTFDGTNFSDLAPLDTLEERKNFSWQWKSEAGIFEEPAFKTDDDGRLAHQPSIDMDGDFQDETVYRATFRNGLLASATVLDFQEGDLDMTFVPEDPAENQGLQEDAVMYSFTSPTPKAGSGTYFRIENGKLYSLNGQFVRNTSRNDQVDIVQRVLKLNRNTGRFCRETKAADGTIVSAVRRSWSAMRPNTETAAPCQAIGVCTLTNPVEVCATGEGSDHCFTEDRVEYTCMDVKNKMIFIRSRLKNISGSRWITRTDLP